MKVIFLNTWHGELRDELRAYVMRHLQSTDVFCFQESNKSDRDAYKDLLADNFVLQSAEKQGENVDVVYGNATYVRKDISIVETGVLFAEGENELHTGLATYLKLNSAEGKVTICNVHGAPYPGHKLDCAARLYQSEKILEKFTDDDRVIIGGDFNLLPDTKSVQMFNEHGYQDLIADFDVTTTRNRITFERFPNDIQYHADYVFVSPGLQVNSFVVPSEIVSDHQPLELSVSISAEDWFIESMMREESQGNPQLTI